MIPDKQFQGNLLLYFVTLTKEINTVISNKWNASCLIADLDQVTNAPQGCPWFGAIGDRFLPSFQSFLDFCLVSGIQVRIFFQVLIGINDYHGRIGLPGDPLFVKVVDSLRSRQFDYQSGTDFT